MPLLNRLTDDKNGHENDDQSSQSDRISPIMPGRAGRPSFSLEALRELVERQFEEEVADRTDILAELDDADKQRAMLREVAEYVLSTRAITLAPKDKIRLIERAFRNLFTLGPLEPFLADESITEITVNGPREIHVRRGMAQMEKIEAAFDDSLHLERTLQRVVAMNGGAFSEYDPFLELGVTLGGRMARMSIVTPPISPDYNLELRLHPRQPVTLDEFHTRFEALPASAATLLRAILNGEHGLLIVGDVGLGKTTLAGALAGCLPPDAPIIAVERATELHLPPNVTRRAAIPQTPETPGTNFETQITQALNENPAWLLIDEIRSDESAAIWDALTRPQAPRYLWVFRGDRNLDRLRSALTMMIRKKNQAVPQPDIYRALATHLPFAVTFRRAQGVPRLHMIAELRLGDEGTLDFAPLLVDQDGDWQLTANQPQHDLELPDNF